MNPQVLMGIDIGTYESKGVLVTPEGVVLAQAAVGHELSLPRPGWAEHDAEGVWWHDFVHLSRALLAQAGLPGAAVSAVGLSAIGQCFLPLDRAGQPLRPALLYGIDSRSQAEVEEVRACFGDDAIRAVIGRELSVQDLGPRALWLQRHEPQVWARTHCIVSSSTYLVYCLTGAVVIDMYTASDSGPMFSIHDLTYRPELTRPLLPLEKLPRPCWSCEVAGRVTPQAAHQTGLEPGTPVIAGTTDAGSEAISAGLCRTGDLMIMYGSTIFFVQKTDRLVPSDRMWASPFLQPGSYVIAAGMNAGGSLTRWFRDQFAPQELQAEQAGGPNAYAALAELAAQSPPGGRGLLALPYFYGERHPLNDPDARGVIAGLTLAHTRADVYRALLESVGFGIRHNVKFIADLGAPPQRCLAVGGGARNQTWLQIVSDITGLEQSVPDQNLGASYGDAFLAGLGIGLFRDLAEISGWVRHSQTIRPDPANRALYDELYGLYLQLYRSSAGVVHHLARIGAANHEL